MSIPAGVCFICRESLDKAETTVVKKRGILTMITVSEKHGLIENKKNSVIWMKLQCMMCAERGTQRPELLYIVEYTQLLALLKSAGLPRDRQRWISDKPASFVERI